MEAQLEYVRRHCIAPLFFYSQSVFLRRSSGGSFFFFKKRMRCWLGRSPPFSHKAPPSPPPSATNLNNKGRLRRRKAGRPMRKVEKGKGGGTGVPNSSRDEGTRCPGKKPSLPAIQWCSAGEKQELKKDLDGILNCSQYYVIIFFKGIDKVGK